VLADVELDVNALLDRWGDWSLLVPLAIVGVVAWILVELIRAWGARGKAK